MGLKLQVYRFSNYCVCDNEEFVPLLDIHFQQKLACFGAVPDPEHCYNLVEIPRSQDLLLTVFIHKIVDFGLVSGIVKLTFK